MIVGFNALADPRSQACTRSPPTVLFTDGDMELAKAIKDVWPSTTHLLCRFHIAQNINRALAGSLRTKLNEFLSDFWRVGCIEDVEEFELEFSALETKWELAQSYIPFLKGKREKWAFAYSHQQFVAGISSTQRQEQVNCEIKKSLMSSSTLERIIDGFDRVEKATAERLIKAILATKLSTLIDDPIISSALEQLTLFAGTLLKQECTLSLSYMCRASLTNPNLFYVAHKDAPPGKDRVVTFTSNSPIETRCSCRKALWHGIVCRHILTVLRNQNHLSCPIELFNLRWRREYAQRARQNILVDRAIGIPSMPSRSGPLESSRMTITEDDRISELAAISKDLILRSASDQNSYNYIKSMFLTASDSLKKSQNLRQADNEDDAVIRNPLKTRCKGRPKTGAKRYISQAEKQQSRRKKNKH